MELAANTHTTTSTFKRIIASIIDYAIYMVYLAGLYFASTYINQIWSFHSLMESSYIIRHFISFSTGTLPILLYFIFMERSSFQATIGKSLLSMRVVHIDGDKAPMKCVIIRNLIKFLPWELAHTIIHLNPTLFTTSNTIAIWLLIIPQVMILAYIAMIIFRKDKRSIYEIVSGTKVVKTSN